MGWGAGFLSEEMASWGRVLWWASCMRAMAREWGARLEGVRKNLPLLAPFLHVYPSLTTLCG